MMQTDTVIIHPDVEFYDFYEAFDTPIQADADAYLGKPLLSGTAPFWNIPFLEQPLFLEQTPFWDLNRSLTMVDSRSGILAQSAPNIGPV